LLDGGRGWVVKSVITTRERKREGPRQVLKKRRRKIKRDGERFLHSENMWKKKKKEKIRTHTQQDKTRKNINKQTTKPKTAVV